MKTLIQLAVVAVIFGGLSAAGTFYYQQRMTPVAAATDQKETTESPSKVSADPDHAEDSEPDHESGSAAADSETEKAAEPIENELAAAEPRKSLQPPAVNPQPGQQPVPGEAISEPTDHRLEAPVAVRPPYAPEGDEAGALINVLRERSRAATETEKRLAQRQDAMQLIFDDLRAEQARTLKIRQRLAHELKESQQAIDAALQGIENDRATMQRDQAESRKASEDAVRAAIEERDKLRKQLAQPPARTESQSVEASDSPEDNANLKKMAAVFDSMPAENVAKVFEQLVKNKKIAAVVSLMNAMKERPAAKVLAVISETNPELAANLTDRLKRLKEATTRPAAE
jgi:hypothetical protein